MTFHSSAPYTRFEQDFMAGLKTGGIPADALAEEMIKLRRQVAAIRRVVKFEHKVFDDDDRAPRPFWHVRAYIGPEESGMYGNWHCYGELGDHRKEVASDFRRKVEETVFQEVIDDLMGVFYAVEAVEFEGADA